MMVKKEISVDKLIEEYYKRNPDGHFFDRETLQFFGEKKSDMWILKKPVTVDYWGEKHRCYVLSTFQSKAPPGNQRKYFYFDCETFKEVFID